MAPRLVAVAILVVLVRFSKAASDGVSLSGDMTDVRAKCESMLGDMSSSKYSEDELAILCRAQLPGPVCREAARQLGPTPWSPMTVGATCKTWVDLWHARLLGMPPEEQARLLEDEHEAVNAAVAQKAATNRCEGYDDVNLCAAAKAEGNPAYTENIDELTQAKSSAPVSAYLTTERVDRAGGVAKFHPLGVAIGFGIVSALVGLFATWRNRRARPSLRALGAEDDAVVAEMLSS